MVPFVSIPVIKLGPLVIHIWGFFVSLGFLAGILMAYWRAKRQGLEANKVFDLALWLIIGSLIGARLIHVIFYEPGYYFTSPLEILKIWQGGFSSFGGLVGGLAAAVAYCKKNRLNFWTWADLLAFTLPLGWGIGRLGCFLTHQHMGIKSNFFLAVAMPDGPRLEMGLLEAIFIFLFFFYFCTMNRRPRPHGFYFINFLIIYGLARFFFDFLRVEDQYYLGLTPAQYGSLLFFFTGVVLAIKRKAALLKCGLSQR